MNSRIFSQIKSWIYIICIAATFSSCTQGVFDYEHPDVEIFVNQLKSGKLAILETDQAGYMPKFTTDDIETLLKYADDLSEIPAFPLAPVSYSAGGKLRLGECLLWTIESIRLGHNASMGCKMVHVDAKITKAFTSYRTKKYWMPYSVTAIGGKGVNIRVPCGP